MEASARLLDPRAAERAELWSAVGAHVHEHLSNLGGRPASLPDAPADPAAFAIAETPAGIADALRSIEVVERSGINQASVAHFAFIPGGGLFPSALGDLLADVSKRYSGIHFASPAALMERSLVRWMADLVGYAATAGGDLTSGASIANLEGIVTARDAAGIRSADVARTVVYLTSQTHHCIEKALRIAGLAECVVRHVALDERWRMRPEELEEAIMADIAVGLRPWLVVATAGTTDTVGVDPLAAIASIAESHDLWLQSPTPPGGLHGRPGRHIRHRDRRHVHPPSRRPPLPQPPRRGRRATRCPRQRGDTLGSHIADRESRSRGSTFETN